MPDSQQNSQQTPQQPPTISSHKDHRRQQLIGATIKTISQYGLSKTTISKVTKTARLSAGIVGFYFSSKEKLLLGTLQALRDESRFHTEAAFNASNQPLEILDAIIELYFAPTLCDFQKIAVWYAFSSESSARKEYMEICGEHDAWFHQSLLGQFGRLCKQAKIDGDKAAAISRGFEGLIDGFWQQYLYQPNKFDRDHARRTCHQYVTLFSAFHGASTAINMPSGEQSKKQDNQTEWETSDSLATWTYRDEELLALEKTQIFRKNWLLVGHVNEMPKPRDYLTLDAIGERAVVIRGNDSQIRAFHNVCRHRGAKLIDLPHGQYTGQCAHTLTCPFHGWTYRLDGELIGVPAEHTFHHLDKSKNGLVALDVEVWMGFVFIRFESGKPSLAETLMPIQDQVATYKIDHMQPLKNTRYDDIRPYNWKVFHDIDNEGYHVPVGHPSLQQLYGKNYTDQFVDGLPLAYGYINDKPAKLWSVRKYQKLLPKFDHLPEQKQKLWLYCSIFPSMVLALYPDSIEFYMTLPVSADKTRVRGSAYALADPRPEINAVRYLNRRINSITAVEDEMFMRRLQNGMQSSVFPQSTLSSLEQGVGEFHQRLQQELPVARLKHHPGSGKMAQINSRLS